MSKEDPPAPPASAASTTRGRGPVRADTAAAHATPSAFPAKADYVGKIPTASGVLTLDITVDGDKAVAYACDGNTVETWLKGSAANGAVTCRTRTGRAAWRVASRVAPWWGRCGSARRSGSSTPTPAQPPAGLYVYENAGVRSSWIVDADGGVTGVQRQADGTTAPAPRLTTDGIAVIDGLTIEAIRVQGDTDDSDRAALSNTRRREVASRC